MNIFRKTMDEKLRRKYPYPEKKETEQMHNDEMQSYVKTLSGELINEKEVDRVVEIVYKTMMSELPERVRTYDMVSYVLRKLKEKAKCTKLEL